MFQPYVAILWACQEATFQMRTSQLQVSGQNPQLPNMGGEIALSRRPECRGWGGMDTRPQLKMLGEGPVLVRACETGKEMWRGLCGLECFRERPSLGCSHWPGNLFPTTEASEPHHPLWMGSLIGSRFALLDLTVGYCRRKAKGTGTERCRLYRTQAVACFSGGIWNVTVQSIYG